MATVPFSFARDAESQNTPGVCFVRLQDVEAGRAIELDTLVGAVKKIGERVGVATPNIGALLGLTRLFGQIRGIYPMACDAG